MPYITWPVSGTYREVVLKAKIDPKTNKTTFVNEVKKGEIKNA